MNEPDNLADRFKQPVSSTDINPLSGKLTFLCDPVAGLRIKQKSKEYYFDSFREDDSALQMITIGRHPNNDIVLNGVDISRLHCIVEKSGDFWTIRDNKALNGTLLYRHEDPLPQHLGESPLVLSLNMKILLPGIDLLPITSSGHVGLFARTQRLFRLMAYKQYGSFREAGRKIEIGPSTISREVHHERKRSNQ